MKKAVLTIIILIGIICVLAINTSKPYHPAQEISNSGGSVFDLNGQAYKCDSLDQPLATSQIDTTKPSHELQQFSKSNTNQESIDSNNNGWPDVGLSISSPSDQLQTGIISHLISEVKQSSASNNKIDSNNNGWPDKCDCILDKTNSDNNNCGNCGIVCSSGQTCCQGVCINLQNNQNNCGSCGNTCQTNYGCCNGVCKNLQSDKNNCGNCGVTCQSGKNCVSGFCQSTTQTITLNKKIECGYASSCIVTSETFKLPVEMNVTFKLSCYSGGNYPFCIARLFKSDGNKIKSIGGWASHSPFQSIITLPQGDYYMEARGGRLSGGLIKVEVTLKGTATMTT